MTYTFNLAPETKGTYIRYSHPGLGSIYMAKTMLAAAPATVTITAEGFAEPKAAKAKDPAALQAAATVAAERAARAAERAQKLAAQVAAMQTATPVAQPTEKPARTRRTKAA